MTSRIPDPADPFEEEGLASPDPEYAAKRITGDPQEEMAVPAERPIASTDWGTTALEEVEGEPMDHRLAREEPDMLARADQPADYSDDADQPYPEDRDERAGRLVDIDEGARADTEPDAVALDVGTDLGGFSAEERAMRIERDPEA